MKNIIIFLLFNLFYHVQQQQSFVFAFNPKKFIQENKLKEITDREVIFNLYDIYGKETKYITSNKTTDILRKAGIYSFKGKSEDGTKLITLTIASGKLSGAYLENGKSYFIEPFDKNCKKKYKIYIKPEGNYQVGQPNDFVP
ncbi:MULTISPECIES: hypothetical protein [Chryseobacterium]|jgi:hypothetical protein|uniref:Uncharacterized protein n=1 Tax=Chryseobacterium rhizosphaerae TaxID=395937 RepID=A0ABX9IG37_9FLAO|nr:MULTISPECIES: hypothetical protein [Chryseobacterium]MBL3550344.1 hypothetical protein [Chryseobacterium sp. KMC2]MDC8100140.1 hypothetical protein [Chryseobacterium rhizosphaerae]MDR6548672.1 hypothetical protein [Chryseobacterium rhizosphaerae]REC72660.1 hypothetical protein DRF57_19080 [Chryseobacterium rhizosphaerae]SMC34757.1 hypothetical protein SAMN02787074_0509 [Chryseobacterium sp. YR221]